MTQNSWPNLGCGVGLRSQHYPDIVDKWPPVDWFEAISENYMDTGGRPLHVLAKVREHYPVAFHGVSLSIGSADPLNQRYLERLKQLIERIEPFIVSDHLCWTAVGGEELHDLMPLPFTEEAVEHIVRRVQRVQEFLGRRILLENVSSYVTYRHSLIPEWEFLFEIAKRSGCGILLDLNNIYVNSVNHRFDPYEYVRSVPGDRVGQFHLAGHTDMGPFLFDTHSSPVIDPVWDLYREALRLWGQKSTLIEWDADIPLFTELLKETDRAREIYKTAPVSLRMSSPNALIGDRETLDSRSFDRLSPSTPLRVVSLSNQMVSEVEPLVHSGMTPVRLEPVLSLADNEKGAGRQSLPVPFSCTLPTVQQRIKHYVQPNGGTNVEAGESVLNPQGGVSGEERMEVYSDGYLARIHESLAEVYESVHQVLGDELFRLLVRSYAERHPSHDYNLNRVGSSLPEFLKQLPITKELPFLPSLAQLEWLIAQAFHAFDQVPFRPDDLRGIHPENWEHLRLFFQPSVSLVKSEWPILDIWKKRGEVNTTPHLSSPRFTGEGKGWGGILISRKEFQVRCESLDLHQYRLIEGLMSGKTLGEVCEQLAEATEEALPISEWFSRWTHDGLIVKAEVGTSDVSS